MELQLELHIASRAISGGSAPGHARTPAMPHNLIVTYRNAPHFRTSLQFKHEHSWMRQTAESWFKAIKNEVVSSTTKGRKREEARLATVGVASWRTTGVGCEKKVRVDRASDRVGIV